MTQVILEPIEDQTSQPITLEPIQEEGGGAVNRLKQYYAYLHSPTEGPKSVKDFLTRVVPASFEKVGYGLAEFPYQLVKSVTDPIIHEKGIKAGATKLGKNIYETAEGLAKFSGEPIGVYGWDKLKERWSTDPAGALLGLLPLVKGVISYAKAKGITTQEAIKEIELDKTFSNFERLKEEQVKATQNKVAGGPRPLGKLVTLERMAESEGKVRAKVGGEDLAKNVFTEENLQRAEDLARAQKGFEERLRPEEQTIDQLHEQAYGEKIIPEELAQRNASFDDRMAEKSPEQLAMDKVREEALKEEIIQKGKIEGFYPTEEQARLAVGGQEGIREIAQGTEAPQLVETVSGDIVAETPKVEGTPRQPWEMTRAEYLKDKGLIEIKNLTENQLQEVSKNDGVPVNVLKEQFGKFAVDEKTMKTVGDGFDDNYASVKKALSEGKPVPPEVLADYPELANKSGETVEPRTIGTILSDINTAIGEKGAVGNLDLTPEQIAARKRLMTDWTKIKDNAGRVGRTVDDYLTGLGVDEKVISSLKGIVVEKPGPEGEQVLVKKGDYVGDRGEKVRSFSVSAATSNLISPEVKQGIIEEIQPGGKGVYTPITLKDTTEKAIQKISADPEKAVRFVKSSRNPGAIHTAVGIELIKKFQNEGNHERAIEIALPLSKRLTTAGQEIAQAKVMGSLSPTGVLIVANRAIEKFNERSIRKAGTKVLPGWVKELELGPETAKNLHDLAKAIQEATDEGMRSELSRELQLALDSITPSTIGQKISTVQIIAQLFNPKTILTRNPLGNELFYRAERLTKYPSALVDWAASHLSGKERTITFRTGGAEQGKYWEGWLTGWKSGFYGENPKGLQTQYELGKAPTFRNKPFEMKLEDGTWIMKMPNRAERVASFLERSLGATLKSFDYAAYNRAYWGTIGEMATLKSINETGKIMPELVKKHISTMDENIIKIADEYGKYVTFQDNNAISMGLVNVKKGLNRITFSPNFGIGDMVLKYPKTPGALLARGLEYSPAGILKAAYEASRSLLTDSTLDHRAINLSIGRAAVGSLGLSALGYFFFDNGIITGPADKDKDAASAQRTMGTHPYKINVSAFKRWAFSGFDRDQAKPQEGDTFYSYDWAQPVAMAIAGGANMAKEYGERKVFTKALKETIKGTPNTIYRGMEAALETLVNQPVLQGILRMTQGYGAEGIASNVVNLAAEAPASFTPTLLNQIRQLTDNTKRTTYNPDMMAMTINKMTNKIPGLAGYLPESYDTLGYQKENYPQGKNTPFNVFLNPGFVSSFLPTDAEEKVLNVFKETGSTKQFPREVGKTIGLPVLKDRRRDTLQVNLTPEEYTLLQKNVGLHTRRLFSKISDDMPVEAQEMAMTQMLTYAGIMGRQSILPSIKKRLGEKLKDEHIIILR